MSFVRCSVCRGQKKIKGLGCMLKKCVACHGTGYKEQNEEIQDEILQNTDTEIDTVKEAPKARTKRLGNPNWRKKDES